jgi:drug/metabolite transporter (DMT)-like permease
MTAGRTGPGLALGAAVLFGLSAPAAKGLIGIVDPWLLAGLLYLGSGVGLGVYLLTRRVSGRPRRAARLGLRDLPWLAAAIVAGGVVGPVLLMLGLASGPATQSALLLNLEGVFTALVAWLVFREHVNLRIATGMLAITAGAMSLAWQPSGHVALDWSAVLVAGACLAWAIDNNLTRKVSANDPVQIATLKGAVAGSVNVLLAIARGAQWPGPGATLLAGLVGLVGYGMSLVLFVIALRHLGTARAGAYFSTAPFVGAAGGLLALGEPLTPQLLMAAALMTAGVWLHVTEHHAHDHVHALLEHDHLHWHDDHHQHDHQLDSPVTEPHAHRHTHEAARHGHPHYPDSHHRHGH